MEALLNELHQEAEAARHLLERVPEERLGWKPHPKSVTLGQLALHVAAITGDLSRLAQLDEFDASNANFLPAMPESTAAIALTLETSLDDAAEYLRSLSADQAAAIWRLTLKGSELFAAPRARLLRSLMLNH